MGRVEAGGLGRQAGRRWTVLQAWLACAQRIRVHSVLRARTPSFSSGGGFLHISISSLKFHLVFFWRQGLTRGPGWSKTH